MVKLERKSKHRERCVTIHEGHTVCVGGCGCARACLCVVLVHIRGETDAEARREHQGSCSITLHLIPLRPGARLRTSKLQPSSCLPQLPALGFSHHTHIFMWGCNSNCSSCLQCSYPQRCLSSTWTHLKKKKIKIMNNLHLSADNVSQAQQKLRICLPGGAIACQ